MPDETSANVPTEAQQVPLPPVVEKLLSDLKSDRKKLLRDKGFESGPQLRAYLGQYLYPRLDEMVRILGGAVMDTYGLAFSNTNELRRLHRFTVDELQRMGSDVDDDVPLPGVSPDTLNEFQERFFALGTLLQEKYPEDKETEAAYNSVAEAVSHMIEELMDGYDDGDEPDDEPEDRGGDDEPEGDDESEPAEGEGDADE